MTSWKCWVNQLKAGGPCTLEGGWVGERRGRGCHFLVGPLWGCMLTQQPTLHPTPSTLSPAASRKTPGVGVTPHPPRPAIYPQKLG